MYSKYDVMTKIPIQTPIRGLIFMFQTSTISIEISIDTPKRGMTKKLYNFPIFG